MCSRSPTGMAGCSSSWHRRRSLSNFQHRPSESSSSETIAFRSSSTRKVACTESSSGIRTAGIRGRNESSNVRHRARIERCVHMRPVYVSIIIVGLASSEMASSQRPVSFGPPEKAAIERLFDGYTAAFSNQDYARLREYVEAPFVRFGPSNTRAETGLADWAVLGTMDDTIGFFRAAQDALKAQGVERFEWGQHGSAPCRVIARLSTKAIGGFEKTERW